MQKAYSKTKLKNKSKKSNTHNFHVSQLSQSMQLNILQNKILLINLTTCITELSKLLVEAGFNIYLHDKELISKTDTINNIILSSEDIGKSRVDILYQKLILVNSTVSIVILKDITKVKDYKIAIVGFSDYESLIEYEDYFNRKGVLFFCINTSGFYSFCYHNLNKSIIDYFFNDKKGKKFSRQSLHNNNFIKKEENFIKNCEVKNDKEGLIFAVFVLDIYYRNNIHKKFMKKAIKDELNGDNDFVKKMYYIDNYLKYIGKKYILKNEFFMNSIKNLIINFNRELNPICNTMAKKIFEILLKIFKNKIFPNEMMYIYNNENLKDFNYNAFN